MQEIEQATALAEKAIEDHAAATRKFARLVAKEMELSAGRTAQKVDAILRVKVTSNPLNPEKAHSVTSATDQVEVDPIYFAYLKKQWETVLAKEEAHGEMIGARLQAELRIALIKTLTGTGVS